MPSSLEEDLLAALPRCPAARRRQALDRGDQPARTDLGNEPAGRRGWLRLCRGYHFLPVKKLAFQRCSAVGAPAAAPWLTSLNSARSESARRQLRRSSA
jgi:hypothetical protein